MIKHLMLGTKKMPLIVTSDQKAMFRKFHLLNLTRMNSNNDSLTFQQALEKLKQHAQTVVKTFPRIEWESAMKNQSAHLGIELDVTREQLGDYLNQAEQAAVAPALKANIVKGGEKFRCRKTKDLLPGFLKQNMFHVLNAEQGTGKSCFVLGLFSALHQEQTGSFLDLEVPSSKNWELFLIAPDMPRESWFTPLANYGLLTNVVELPNDELEGDAIESVTLACQDVPYSLSPDHIQEFRQMAMDSVAKGNKPLFVFDSYRSLAGAWKSCDEIKSQFADPLQDLYTAMSGTGATTIVLHHTSKGKSGSVASSGSGTNRMGSIPDIVLELERMNKSGDRMVLSSAKRVTPSSLIVQQHYDQGYWEARGCAKAWMEQKQLTEEISRLSTVKTTIFEYFQTIWMDQQRGLSKQDIARFREISKVAAGNHVNYLAAKNLIFAWDQEETAGGFADLFYPFEARDDLFAIAAKKLMPSKPCERGSKPGENRFTEGLHPSGCNGTDPSKGVLTRARTQTTPEGPCETPGKPYETLGNLNNLTNVYGQNVPSVRQMVEDEHGANSMVIVELVPGTAEVKVQEFGNSSAPIKQRRWMADIYPCGWHAKHNPPTFDEDEVL